MDRKKLEKWAATEQVRAEKTLAKFRENFDVSPDHAFEWSTGAFAAAAQQSVAAYVQSVLVARPDDPSDVVSEIRQAAAERVHRSARFPARSTSVQSNEMETWRTAAWADLLHRMDGGI